MSANTSADALVDTLPMHRPTHYRRVGRHTTNSLADSLKSGRRVSWHSVDCPSTVIRLSTNALADVLVDVSVGSDSLPVLYLIFQVPFSPGLYMYNVNKHYFSKMKQQMAKKKKPGHCLMHLNKRTCQIWSCFGNVQF